MTRPDMHVTDYGTLFQMTVLNRNTNKPLDMQGIDTKVFLFEPPTSDAFVRDAEFLTDGSDGKLVYTFVENDVTDVGKWRVQALVLDIGGQWHTDIETFEVGENIIVEGS